jgi:hypothetical protein
MRRARPPTAKAVLNWLVVDLLRVAHDMKLREVDLSEWQAWWKRDGRNRLNALPIEHWNPIGVRVPNDEYASYAGHVGRLLREETPTTEIAAYLASVRTERIEVKPTPRLIG